MLKICLLFGNLSLGMLINVMLIKEKTCNLNLSLGNTNSVDSLWSKEKMMISFTWNISPITQIFYKN